MPTMASVNTLITSAIPYSPIASDSPGLMRMVMRSTALILWFMRPPSIGITEKVPCAVPAQRVYSCRHKEDNMSVHPFHVSGENPHCGKSQEDPSMSVVASHSLAEEAVWVRSPASGQRVQVVDRREVHCSTCENEHTMLVTDERAGRGRLGVIDAVCAGQFWWVQT